MKYTETPVWFSCEGDLLLGIVAQPQVPAETGVVVVVGGPQYRVGSHRQFVLLSRALATAGYPVLRFDYRGMGDSEGSPRNFQSVHADIAAAIGALQKQSPGVKRVALWGLCDGASAALLYCHETGDSQVGSLCLLNPWVRSEVSLARVQVQHYYWQRARQKDFWLKLLQGKVGLAALRGVFRNIQVAATHAQGAVPSVRIPGRSSSSPLPFQQRMAAAWDAFSGSIFLLLSDDDYVAKEFLVYANNDSAWKNAMKHPRLVRHELPGADHTFSGVVHRIQAEELTLRQGLHHPAPPR